MNFLTAINCLDDFCLRIDGKIASTNRVLKNGANPEALRCDWWYENSNRLSDFRGTRNVAYLSAYVTICGDEIPMDGIRLDDGFIWPDRAVMRSFDMAGCVLMREGVFKLTEKGHQLIAPYLSEIPTNLSSDQDGTIGTSVVEGEFEGLPRKIWLRSFYGFSPGDDGYIGWSEENARDRMLGMVESGDLFLIYGASSNQTVKAQRNRVIGFLQIDAQAIMDQDKSSDAGMERKRENGWLSKWCYAMPVKRAWRVDEPVLLETIAPETYRPEAGQAIAVWSPALEPEEVVQALKIRVTEVSVFGEPAISEAAIMEETFANAFKPSRAFPGSTGERISTYEDGDTFMYLARFDGNGHALIGREKAFGNKSAALKIGISNDPKRRLQELNSGIPPAAKGKWILKLISQPYIDRKAAEAVEQEFKNQGVVKLESLGKEFFWGDWTVAMLIFASLPGTSRF